MFRRILLRVSAFAALCSMTLPAHEAAAARRDPLDEVSRWLSGSFSSAAQAARDTGYRDVRLHIVPIWRERGDARWFFVEQAVATALERPYRQRVYRLTRAPDGVFESAVFTIPSPLRFAGAWRQRAPLATLAPDSLTRRDGCSVFLSKQPGGGYAGGTRGTGCASELRGAAYATSEVVLTKTLLRSWDRGYDREGRQVWGATAGGYEFVRERK